MSLKKLWRRRQNAYQTIFRPDSPVHAAAAHLVLTDLAKFCNAHKPSIRVSNGAVDSNATLIAEGRREVWLRIQTILHIIDDDIIAMTGETDHD